MAAAVIISSSKVAAALVLAVFAVFATYAEAGGWLPAKATWYGAPNGAGPDDNGMHEQSMAGANAMRTVSAVSVCVCVRLTFLSCLQVARAGTRTPTSTRTCP
jgi:hypothetical protein